MNAALSREFLVQRLVADSLSRKAPHSDESDSSSDTGTDMDHNKFTHKPENFVQSAFRQMPPGGAFMPSPLHYAATLASLAQINFMQPNPAALSMMYPQLYQSLFNFPNLEQLKSALHSPQKSPTPTPKALSSPQSLNLSPSPRKRQSQKITKSEEKPRKESKQTTISVSPSKKARGVKKIFSGDEEMQSPVTGMFIKEANSMPSPALLQAEADLDDSAKWVEITEEAKMEIAKINNVIGDYICCLCKVKYEDAFKLAQHRCPRIVHEEYRCPECSKVFSCPANLASHRRWHKPRVSPTDAPTPTSADEPLNLVMDVKEENQGIVGMNEEFVCEQCGLKCNSHRMLRDHALEHTQFGSASQDNVKLIKLDNNHSKLMSTESTVFSCKYCPETFSASPALTRHLNKKHSNEKIGF